jgi:hypothetical protein
MALATYTYVTKREGATSRILHGRLPVNGEVVTLTASVDQVCVVRSSVGGTWTPGPRAMKGILGSATPEIEALRICVEMSSWGRWE